MPYNFVYVSSSVYSNYNDFQRRVACFLIICLVFYRHVKLQLPAPEKMFYSLYELLMVYLSTRSKKSITNGYAFFRSEL